MAAAETTARDISDADVASVFDAYPAPVRIALLTLRGLILETAAQLDGVGPVEEALRWGQPAYLTSASGSGTTIRIDAVKSMPGRYALYVHCQTNLIETYKQFYPDELSCDGNRAVLFDVNDPLPRDAVGHCIALALTYHLRKRRAGAKS